MEDFDVGGMVWNPLLRTTKLIAKDEQKCGKSMGYDGTKPEKSYKIIGRCFTNAIYRVAVLELATNAWKVTHCPRSHEELGSHDGSSSVSLNGNLYWTGYKYPDTGQCFIEMLDLSKEVIKFFCILPCKANKSTSNTRILSIYKGDRFSVLQQSKRTGEVNIWVTEKEIGNGDNGDDVVWIKFMTLSRPDFPILLSHTSTSYFVDNDIYGKSLVLCCPSTKPRQAWVYIVRGDLCKKIKIDGVQCRFKSSVYVPSLITIT
ncbi:unnamed protein product [Arabidopsis thaliana]|uniref:F-box associated beta-propeller type 1 domain-containing protein n=1 Tax=Arabidopsis thaliana TaxID=3702 RepID=A0A654EPJ7_ARATH|nr:unnamed protein product [Arabidopsis thaliana]